MIGFGSKLAIKHYTVFMPMENCKSGRILRESKSTGARCGSDKSVIGPLHLFICRCNRTFRESFLSFEAACRTNYVFVARSEGNYICRINGEQAFDNITRYSCLGNIRGPRSTVCIYPDLAFYYDRVLFTSIWRMQRMHTGLAFLLLLPISAFG